MEGVFESVNRTNPHPTFDLTVTGEDGNEQTWEIQAFGSLYTLTRGGVSGDSFEPGKQVRIAGQVSTRRDNILLANNVLLPDGREVILNGGAEPYFNESAEAGGQAHWAATIALLRDGVPDLAGLFEDFRQVPVQQIALIDELQGLGSDQPEVVIPVCVALFDRQPWIAGSFPFGLRPVEWQEGSGHVRDGVRRTELGVVEVPSGVGGERDHESG